MKNINFILYILLLLILITLFYNSMLKEHFIDSVTEICNTRKKLNLGNFKDISGDQGNRGVVGRSGRRGQLGNDGDRGIPGENGLDAMFIGIINFRDILTDEIICTVEEKNNREIDNKVTNIKLLRGEDGDNARMNPIIFKDSQTGIVISKQHIENYDLNPIVVSIKKGDKGIDGKNAICEIPSKRGIDGIQGPPGDQGPDGEAGLRGRDAEAGGVIENPEFELILTDNLCIDNLCIDLNTFRGIHTRIDRLTDIVAKEEEYNNAIRAASNTATTEECECLSYTPEQFTNYNSGYCTKIIKGDKGDDGAMGQPGTEGNKGERGRRGRKGHNGIDGEEIPNIDFYDKKTESLIGRYNSVDKNAETKKIYLKNGVKGNSGYIPTIIFKYTNDIIDIDEVTHDKEITTNESNENIDDIIVYLDNSIGPPGREGIDGVCRMGSEGPQGEEGTQGPVGDPGPRGYDGKDGEPGDAGPEDKNPSYITIKANKYCFSNGTLSDICLNDTLLSKLINSKKGKDDEEQDAAGGEGTDAPADNRRNRN